MTSHSLRKAAFVFGLLGIGFGCGERGSSTNSGNDARSSTNSASQLPDLGSADPRAEVDKAIKSLLEARSYRVRTEVTGSTGKTNVREFAFSAPDRTRVAYDANDRRRETITIGTDTYLKEGDVPWKKTPLSILDKLVHFYPKVMAEMIGKSPEVKYLGAESIEGKPMKSFEYTFKDSLNPGKERSERVWIGVSDGLLYKVETEMDSQVDGRTVQTKMTRQLFDYGADIKIDAPI